MSVAKYVDGITLMQPVDRVGKVERLAPYNRNNEQKNPKQNDSFDSFFRKAISAATTEEKHKNGFNILC